MGSNNLCDLEIDAIGEILNISLGASATAVSTMLNTRVDITTPVVEVVSKDEFKMDRVEPAVGVEITYISGLEGSNIMLLKRHDVKVIVEMLMGISMTDEEFELNEMNISAVCEVMNQMMGASSTALSEFLGRMVNISTPISFEVKNEQEFLDKYFVEDEPQVVVGFSLKIADKLESEFFNVMPISLAKSLVQGFLPEEAVANAAAKEAEKKETAAAENGSDSSASSGKSLSQEEIERMLSGGADAAGEPAQPTPEAVTPEAQSVSAAATPEAQPVMQQMTQPTPDASMMQMQMQMMQQMMQMMEEKQKAPEPKIVNVQPAARPNLSKGNTQILQEEQEENMELIMGVPLEISVEIGRTKKLVKDILDFTKGSLVVLDKLAGEQVDLFVNGQCIAKGDVVVVEDNFGIRITEIMKMNLPTLE